MNDNYTNFEFEIQLLYTYHESNGIVYTLSVFTLVLIFDLNNCQCQMHIALDNIDHKIVILK